MYSKVVRFRSKIELAPRFSLRIFILKRKNNKWVIFICLPFKVKVRDEFKLGFEFGNVVDLGINSIIFFWYEYEIADIITNLNDHKSAGYIDIPVTIIEKSKLIIASYVAQAFNMCLESGEYPDILKIAKVVPLHKGGSKSELGNYRPISIKNIWNSFA